MTCCPIFVDMDVLFIKRLPQFIYRKHVTYNVHIKEIDSIYDIKMLIMRDAKTCTLFDYRSIFCIENV